MKPTHLLYAAIALFIACWHSVGFHQADEHFQILEFANYKLGFLAEENLTWEFGEQMRPAFQPAIVYITHEFFALFGEVNPHWVAFTLRLFSAALFLGLAVLIYRRYKMAMPTNLLGWFSLLLLFHWCTIYSGIRFSGENWSGLFAGIGFMLYPIPHLKNKNNVFTPASNGPAITCFAAGVLFGLSFLLRYQMALGVVGFGAWLLLVGKERWGRLSLTILGGLLALTFGSLLDYWMYGEWVLAPWHYLRINVFEGVAATYGSRPVWAYLSLIFLRGIPPLSIVYLVAIGWFVYRYRRDPLTWLFIAFFVVHSVLSRKDIRFVYPLLPFLPIAIIAGVKALKDRTDVAFFKQPWVKRTLRLCVVLNLGLLASVMIRPAATEMLPAYFVYKNYPVAPTIYSDRKLVYNYGLLTIDFYQRPGTTLIEGRPGPCPSDAPCLYSAHTHKVEPLKGAKLVYTNRPSWFKAINYGGWQDSMKWWYVYEMVE